MFGFALYAKGSRLYICRQVFTVKCVLVILWRNRFSSDPVKLASTDTLDLAPNGYCTTRKWIVDPASQLT
jgi:hypothetical protein